MSVMHQPQSVHVVSLQVHTTILPPSSSFRQRIHELSLSVLPSYKKKEGNVHSNSAFSIRKNTDELNTKKWFTSLFSLTSNQPYNKNNSYTIPFVYQDKH